MNNADNLVADPPAVCPFLCADEHIGEAGEGGVEKRLDGGRDEERRREEHGEDQHDQAYEGNSPSRIWCSETNIDVWMPGWIFPPLTNGLGPNRQI